MISYLQSILGTYTQLPGEGIATLNVEYIVGAILLIMAMHLTFKFLFHFINCLFGVK